MKTIAVIGLGKFGFYVAKSLSRLDVKVIAVDNDEKKVQEIERRGPTEDIDEDDAGRQKKKNTIFLQISLFFKRRQTSKRKFESR